MRSLKAISCSLLILAVLGGCASADKRFNQGSEMEAKGQYEQAVMRYVQALEKDSSLDAARNRLIEVGDLAIIDQLAEADSWISRSDPVKAADHYRRADNVVTRARSVGVRLALPQDYNNQRRDVFENAFENLLAHSAMAREQGRWQESLASSQRARQDFEPTMDQRNRALAAEAAVYVGWSESEYAREHWRSAFDIAASVQQMEWSPATQSALANELMEDCLDEGEIDLIVLPLQPRTGSNRERSLDRDLVAQTETALWHGPWRQPPPFVAMHEPLGARDLMSNAGILDGDYNAGTVALILRLAEADYGAHLQIIDSEATEFDVKSQTKNVRTRDGRNTNFVKEVGQRRIQATARVVIADGFGNEIANLIVAGSGTSKFARGVYSGDHRDLNLGAQQVDLFDRLVLEDQEQAAHMELVHDLAANIADAVYGQTLAQVQ